MNSQYAPRRQEAEAKTQSTALTVQDAPPVRRVGRIAPFANPNRRNSAFLAHLTLQYDDKTAQSRRITEQRALAVSAYETGTSSGRSAETLPKRGLKI